MRIIDKDGNEILNPDYSLGYYLVDTIIIAHHPAQEYIPEQFHYEVVAEYPNGGKDVEKIIDVPGQEAKDAWDEMEDVLRWHWYSDDDPRPPASMIAKENIEKDSYFMVDNVLYYALSSIPAGGALKPGKNCNKIDIATALNAINL